MTAQSRTLSVAENKSTGPFVSTRPRRTDENLASFEARRAPRDPRPAGQILARRAQVMSRRIWGPSASILQSTCRPGPRHWAAIAPAEYRSNIGCTVAERAFFKRPSGRPASDPLLFGSPWNSPKGSDSGVFWASCEFPKLRGRSGSARLSARLLGTGGAASIARR